MLQTDLEDMSFQEHTYFVREAINLNGGSLSGINTIFVFQDINNSVTLSLEMFDGTTKTKNFQR